VNWLDCFLLGHPEITSRHHPHQDWSFTCQFDCWWVVYHFKNTYSPITFANISFYNLVFIFRCSSSPINPVYVSRVDFSTLVFSLSSHRHSYIGLVCIFLFLDSWWTKKKISWWMENKELTRVYLSVIWSRKLRPQGTSVWFLVSYKITPVDIWRRTTGHAIVQTTQHLAVKTCIDTYPNFK
jgi:hypothetical protein